MSALTIVPFVLFSQPFASLYRLLSYLYVSIGARALTIVVEHGVRACISGDL